MELHLKIRDCRLRSIAVGLRRIQRASRVRVVQSGQQLPWMHVSAFVEKYTRNPPCDFRGDRGPPSRSDITACVQDRLQASCLRLLSRDDLHDGRLIAQRERSPGDQDDNAKRGGSIAEKFPGLAARAMAVLDPQRTQIRLCLHFRRGHQFLLDSFSLRPDPYTCHYAANSLDVTKGLKSSPVKVHLKSRPALRFSPPQMQSLRLSRPPGLLSDSRVSHWDRA